MLPIGKSLLLIWFEFLSEALSAYWTLLSRFEFHRQHEVLAVCGTVSFVKIFLDECFAKVFLNLNLFSLTTAQVSLMCQRLVDFYEPIYHRLLSRFHTFETLFSFLFKVFKKLFQFVLIFKGFFGMFLSVFHPLAVLLLRWISCLGTSN